MPEVKQILHLILELFHIGYNYKHVNLKIYMTCAGDVAVELLGHRAKCSEVFRSPLHSELKFNRGRLHRSFFRG